MADKNTFEGTTTVGITCKDGVVFASERRASMGNLVAHKVAEKIFKIDNHIAATIAGSVADAQSLMKIISAETALYRLRNGKDISLEAAAAVSSNILHSSPAYVQTLIGGVDDTGASIYSLDAAGGMIKDTFISTGSGSTFAYGVLEDRFHEEITVEEWQNIFSNLNVDIKNNVKGEIIELITPNFTTTTQTSLTAAQASIMASTKTSL